MKVALDSDDEALVKKIKTLKTKTNGSNIDNKLTTENDTTKKKPRIQLKLRTTDESKNKNKPNDGKPEKKPLKRKRDDERENKIGEEDANTDAATIPKKHKKDATQAKKKIAKTDESGNGIAKRPGNDGASNDTSIFLNIKFWKQCRESLNGTFKAARKNLTQFDGWTLPSEVADKFTEIANSTLEKMNK